MAVCRSTARYSSGFGDVKYVNVERQQTVDGFAQVVHGDGIDQSECGHLSQRVDSGIGAPRPGHMHWLPLHVRNNLFEDALNGRQSGLYLPSMERATIVSQVDANAAHYAGREPGFSTGIPSWHRGHCSG